MQVDKLLVRIGTWIVSSATIIWANIHPLSQVLAIVMLADIILGVIPAAKKGKLSSAKARCGITKKTAVLVIVAMCELADKLLGAHTTFAPTAAGFYIAFVELPSIIENAHRLGVPFPDNIRKWFEQMGEQDEHQLEGTDNREEALDRRDDKEEEKANKDTSGSRDTSKDKGDKANDDKNQ